MIAKIAPQRAFFKVLKLREKGNQIMSSCLRKCETGKKYWIIAGFFRKTVLQAVFERKIDRSKNLCLKWLYGNILHKTCVEN